MNTIDMVQPETEDLDAAGDWWGDLRLPEFSYDWLDDLGARHPLRVVGRYLKCAVHDDVAVRGMAVTKSSPCRKQAELWHARFRHRFSANMTKPPHAFIQDNLYVRVAATLVRALADRLQVSPEYAADLWELVPELQVDPAYVDGALERGVDYEIWGKLRKCNMMKLARPGLIKKGRPVPGLQPYLNYCLANKVVLDDVTIEQMLDVATRWNIFGCLVEAGLESIGASGVARQIIDLLDEEEQIGDLVAEANFNESNREYNQATIRAEKMMTQEDLASKDELRISETNRVAYQVEMVPDRYVAEDIELGIGPQVAGFWARLGVLSGDDLVEVRRLKRLNPELGVGVLAFWAKGNSLLSKAEILGQVELAPLVKVTPFRGTKWWGELDAWVVEPNWWQRAPLVELPPLSL